MGLEGNVIVGTSQADDCFVCERRTATGTTVVYVKFRIPAFVTTIEVCRAMHVECAEELATVLGRRILEARNESGPRKPRKRDR